jgi:putative holliday junction resolvase
MLTSTSSILALDVGGKRIGVATANVIARIAHPLTTITNDDDVLQTIEELIRQEQAAVVIVGLPRGLDGQRTAQTGVIDVFVEELKQHISVPVHMQDEAVTSRQAEAELAARSKTYRKEDIDALAATYILEDFLHEHPEAGR